MQSSHDTDSRTVKEVTMDDLFSLNDIPPPYQKRETPAPVSPDMQREIADFYQFHFAVGLNKLLETDWYTIHGLAALQSTPALHDFVSQCVEQFKSQSDTTSTNSQIKSLEARLVWHLATMPRHSSQDLELMARIDTLESLLTGQYLDPSRTPPAPMPADESKYNEQAFWHHLGRCTAARDDRPDAAVLQEINSALAAMRGILNMLENRDVLYSVAIGRHIGGRMPDFHPSKHLVASTNDANDDINKLKVAHQFVETEDQRGTTQVIQRICGMAMRGWALQKQ
jgi:white-opaque regulator 2